MTERKPEALRLADALETGTYLLSVERDTTAAELSRLHAANVDCMAWYEAIKSDYEAMRKAVVKLHAAKGRYHTQIAACELYDLLGLENERPTLGAAIRARAEPVTREQWRAHDGQHPTRT